MKHRLSQAWAFVLMAALSAASAMAQEPTFMDAATHPGTGQFYSRLLISHAAYEDGQGDADLSTATLKLSYGIRPTLAVVLEGNVENLAAEEIDDDAGLGTTTLRAKYRLFKKDLGPLNTWRTSLFAGFSIPGDVDPEAPDDPYPRCSVASTAILGRHGLNAGLGWEEYGDKPDRIPVNASHLFRLSPSEYTVTTKGAWYTMVESLNTFTDDGDSRFDLALGVLYEARRWAWEISVRLPLAQDWPREADYTVTMGLRFLP